MHHVILPFRLDVHCGHIGSTGGGICAHDQTYVLKTTESYFDNSPWIRGDVRGVLGEGLHGQEVLVNNVTSDCDCCHSIRPSPHPSHPADSISAHVTRFSSINVYSVILPRRHPLLSINMYQSAMIFIQLPRLDSRRICRCSALISFSAREAR